jgi:hypothetical protein
VKYLVVICLFSLGLVSSVICEEAGIPVTHFRETIDAASMRFEDYKTRNTFNYSPKPPVLDTSAKRQFRTALRDAAKKKPNFDGKYVITSWGCGTNCQQFAIIDLETGTVTLGATTEWGLAFRPDSSLLVVNDPDVYLLEYQRWNDGMVPMWIYTRYYQWTGKELVLLKSVNRPDEKETAP